jgi:signal transduction histidine kinase
VARGALGVNEYRSEIRRNPLLRAQNMIEREQSRSFRLDLASRHKSEFLANMSHELRTPLNAIIGFSEVMESGMAGPMSDKQKEFATDIRDSGKHLLSLINDILDLSKAEAGKLQLNEGEVDLADAIEAVRRLVAVRAGDSHIALRTRLAPKLPPLQGDARLVKQMILNLLSNAIKFTPARGSVTVTAGRDDADALFVSIADTGPGIAAADIPRILQAYGRADAIEKSATEGTGLGLTLVKTMIELHGGALELESRPGAGSTFTLRFPPARTGLAQAA